MNHRVTVGAERYEVIGWVNHVYTFEGVVGIHMMNLYEAGETALRLAKENSVFNGYPQELYDSIYEGIEDQYYYFFGDAYTSFISEEG